MFINAEQNAELDYTITKCLYRITEPVKCINFMNHNAYYNVQSLHSALCQVIQQNSAYYLD